MNHLSEGSRGKVAPRRRPTSLDLILSARAMRYQWLVAALAGLQAKLGRLRAQVAIRPRPGGAHRPAYAQHGGAGR